MNSFEEMFSLIIFQSLDFQPLLHMSDSFLLVLISSKLNLAKIIKFSENFFLCFVLLYFFGFLFLFLLCLLLLSVLFLFFSQMLHYCLILLGRINRESSSVSQVPIDGFHHLYLISRIQFRVLDQLEEVMARKLIQEVSASS